MRSSPWRGLCPWVLLLAATSFGATGCGSSTASISGKVFYKGAPLKGGNVTFISAKGKGGGSSTIDPDGSYSIPKLPTGEMKLTVETDSLKPTGGMGGRAFPKNTPPKDQKPPEGYKMADPAETAKLYIQIPDKYKDSETSGLSVTVKSGVNQHDIKLD